MTAVTLEQKNRRIGIIALVLAMAMLGLGFASVPLYRIFCQVTGFDGTTQRADSAPEETLDREITVRFDGNVANGLGWTFRPLQRQVKLRVGEVREVSFLVENRAGHTTTGQAAFNVTPNVAGIYFNKLACFCFTEQTLAAGEKVEMPVQFFVDPAIADDRELKYVNTITLSYTFFPSEPAVKPVAAAPGSSEKPL